jgi:molybdopterin-guanine dinucleotide biosynthesis protein A
MNDRSAVIGLILAGGQARRMGGSDKPLLTLAGRPLLAHVVERLRPQAGALVISANGDPSRFASFGLPVVADGIVGFAGPLAGVLAGMRWAEASWPDATHLVSAAADTPFLPADLVERLWPAAGRDQSRIVVAASAGRPHPTAALWPMAMAGEIAAALDAGERKVMDFVERHDRATVAFPVLDRGGLAIDPFFNVNRPEDLAAAEAMARALAT